MFREGPIVSEPQYICDVCGKKKPVSQMAGKCVKCGKYVCSECAKLKGDKVYCQKCAGACFIATAAYGTPMAFEIDLLREFRDKELEPNTIGRHVVKLYYTISPPIAHIISCNERMRALVRASLKPIVNHFKLKYMRQENNQ
ncbi:MAG: CFI-box-CTERM domain-containing protein [Candidatus Bathyarchaeales archaeon]